MTDGKKRRTKVSESSLGSFPWPKIFKPSAQRKTVSTLIGFNLWRYGCSLLGSRAGVPCHGCQESFCSS